MKRAVSVLLLFLLSATNFHASAENAQVLLQDAQKLISEEKDQEATVHLETILKQFPDTRQAKDVVFLITSCYIKLDQSDKAEETYLKALEQYKNDTVYIVRIHNALADFYTSQKQYQKTTESYRAILKTKPDYTTYLQLVDKIEKACVSQKDYSAAAEERKQLLAIYPRLLEEYRAETQVHAYWRTRTQVDRFNFLAGTHNLISGLQEKAGETGDFLSTLYLLTGSFSQSPFAIRSFHTIAEHLVAQDDYDGAVVFYLSSIIRSSAPLLPFRAIRTENRDFINTSNRERLTAAEVSQTLGKIYPLLYKTAEDARLQEIITSFLKPWEQAHRLMEQGKLIQAAALYEEIGVKTEEPFNLLARYMTALCYSHYGDYLQTLEILQPFLGNKRSAFYRITKKDTPLQSFSKTLNLFSVELAGTSYFNMGQYSDAENLFRITAPFSLYSRYYMGRCHEFQGRIKEAKSTYQSLLEGDEQYFAELSGCHLARLNMMEDSFAPVSHRQDMTAVYAGEDRVTKGNWTATYGDYLYVLCAMAGYFDITGGKASNLFRVVREVNNGQFSYEKLYRIYTGNTKISACRWITSLEEKREEFLVNPLTGSRRSANWDDQGELYNIGEGPDFFLDMPLPEDGLFILSLYFLNDPNFYEPNRQYTVYLKDKHTGNILTATEVKDSGGGVYKHFLVSGPGELTVRACRDLSLNTLLSGVFLDRLERPLDIPDMFAPESEKTIRTVEHFKRLVKNWQANVPSWQKQKKDWLVLRKQALSQLDEEPSTADTFILRWMLAETSRQIPLTDEIQKSEDSIISILASRIKQPEKKEDLPDMLEKVVFYTLENNRKNLGEKLTALYLECLPGEEATERIYSFARKAETKRSKGERNYTVPAAMAYRKLMGITGDKPVAEYTERYVGYMCGILQTLNPPERGKVREELKTTLNRYLETVGAKDSRKMYHVFHRLVFLKEEEEALQVLKKLISGYPESPGIPDALTAMVNYYWLAGKQQEAKTWAQEFLKRFPGHPYKEEVNRMAQISFAQYREQLRENRRKQ